jgi:hypothetical protein
MEGWGPDHCHVRRGPIVLRKHGVVEDAMLIAGHGGIRGKIFFEGGPGGDPQGVSVKLMQGENEILTGIVDYWQNPDGSYYYWIMPPVQAGGYTVRASYGDDVQNKSVSVPDECTAAHPDTDGGGTTPTLPGAHQTVTGPNFTFVLQGEGGGEG